MEQSPRLSLSYVAPAQAQKHVTVNETFRRLDAIVQLTIRSRNVSAEPAAPAEGAAYVLPLAATGAAWGGFAAANLAVFQDGAWAEIVAAEGMRAYVIDEEALVVFDGAAWKAVSSGSSGGSGDDDSAPRFGVNTTADDTNRLAVKSDAVLFSYDDATPGSGDCRVKVNKSSAGGTASHLFQGDFSGRAEFGLTGDEDFHLKVSADGAAWRDALVVNKDSGFVGLGAPAPAGLLHLASAGATEAMVAGDGAGYHNGAVVFLANDGTNGRATGVFCHDAGGGTEWFFGRPYATSDRFSICRQETAAHHPSTCSLSNQLLYVDSNGGLVVGGPSGGAKGAGTINAKAVYDDNALLSCYVFDQVLDGGVDLEIWDARVPDETVYDAADGEGDDAPASRAVPRAHEPVRMFAARVGGDHDPLTLDGYARHWREKRHLTAMPNKTRYDPRRGLSTGEWVQRLVETAEIQAVLIEALNARLKDVEARLAEAPLPEDASPEGTQTEGKRP